MATIKKSNKKTEQKKLAKTSTKKVDAKKTATKKTTSKKATSAKKSTKAVSKNAKTKKSSTVKTTKKVSTKKSSLTLKKVKVNEIVLLLKQHVGKHCVPVVEKGDKVDVGQLVATAQGLGANIHSSVKGIVSKVSDIAIYIEPTAVSNTIPHKVSKLIKANKKDLLGCVVEAGVVGMGGAGFPTGVKLSTNLNKGYILVNAAECEPLLAHNMAQIMKYPKETIKGIQYCMQISNASKAIIAIKQKHQKEVECLLDNLKGISDIHIHLLPDIYPMGDERAVVRECLGKLIPVTELPSSVNAHVCNIETVLRVYEAIEFRRPTVSKNVTVVGKLKCGNEAQVLFDLPIGMKVKDVLEMVGGIDGKYGEIIMGGPFMGVPCKLDDPITKTTGGIIVTKPFTDMKNAKVGLLVCACGGNEARLKDLANKMNMKIVGETQYCKQALDPKGNGVLKCENPGNCPGQALKCMNIKKAGATEILISNCSDCTNTVMGSAPGLHLNVHHETDHVFETVGMEVMRHLTKSKFVEGNIPDGCSASVNLEEVKNESHFSFEDFKHYEFKEMTSEGEIYLSVEKGADISVTYED